MTDVIDLLLNMEIPVPQTKEYKVKRLSKLCGQDVTVKLKELSYSRVSEIMKLHENDDDIAIHILLAGTVEPNLKDKSLMEKFGALTPAELVKKLFSPGEITDISRAAERLSGYRTTTIEEVKKN